MIKITSIMRKMKNDREFCDAVFALIDAQDRLREMERNHKAELSNARFDAPRYNGKVISSKSGLPNV